MRIRVWVEKLLEVSDDARDDDQDAVFSEPEKAEMVVLRLDPVAGRDSAEPGGESKKEAFHVKRGNQ
jgi:hypothetical protein